MQVTLDMGSLDLWLMRSPASSSRPSSTPSSPPSLFSSTGATILNKLGVAARIARFIHLHPHLDKPYLLTLTGAARIQLADN